MTTPHARPAPAPPGDPHARPAPAPPGDPHARPAPAPAAESAAAPYQAAQRQRAELKRAMQDFEHAIAAPAGDPDWRGRAGRALAALRDRLADHLVVTEGPDGLYSALLTDAPRLARPVAQLAAEHGELLRRVDALARELRTPTGNPETARSAGGALLSALSQHRQRGADLVYEAYATDIGGEN